ncbi:O-antigen ligase family protein [Ferruginivarius sediminum]|uniref:O-antigen ligase family protein n=1 Tax=Ferruginivarius sediminum TaxID=2661937 RepID=A0A369TDY3_9PROT|nr:O-antigen ligase family protein [Ferruginivarius sediminum]
MALPGSLRFAMRLLLLALPAMALLADKAVVPWLLIAATLAAIPAVRKRRLPLRDVATAVFLAVLLAYAGISAAWGPDPMDSLGLAVRIAGTVGIGMILIGALMGLAADQRAALLPWLQAGVALALGLLIEEQISDFAIWRLLHDPEPSRYHMISSFNRGVTLLALLVWPAALFALRRWGHLVAAACPLLVLALISGYESAAAIAALGIGGGVAVLAWLSPIIAFAVLVAALGFAFLGAPLVLWAAPADVLAKLDISALPATIDVRIDIWRFVTARFLEKPLFGWGLDAARFMNGAGEWPGESPIRLHPHNNVLQLLMELGFAAALPTVIWLGVLARRVSRAGRSERACFAGFFATALVIACTAYGLWQTQWLSSLLVAVAVLMLAARPSSGSNAELESASSVHRRPSGNR